MCEERAGASRAGSNKHVQGTAVKGKGPAGACGHHTCAHTTILITALPPYVPRPTPCAQIHQLASLYGSEHTYRCNSESAHPTTPPRIRSASEMWGSRSILLAQMRRGVVARSLRVQHGSGACGKQGVGGRGVAAQHQGPPHTHLFSSRRCSSFLATGICSRCSNEHVCAAMVGGGGGGSRNRYGSSLNSG